MAGGGGGGWESGERIPGTGREPGVQTSKDITSISSYLFLYMYDCFKGHCHGFGQILFF